MSEACRLFTQHEMAAEIPVWVNNRQRWVTGIGRKTTCDDVISVLLKSEGHDIKDDVGNQGFAIMERWRRMERPLDGRSRILRVWNAWGDAQDEVRFTLRRVDWDADSGRGSPPGAGGYGGSAAPFATRRRKHHHHHRKPPWPPQHHQTIHPRRLAQLHNHEKLPETIERLMKLILVQGETIQSQLRRLHDRDHQIERLEGETHRARVQALGSNYLLETYLGGARTETVAEKSNDSGVVTEGGSSDQTPPPPAEDDDDLKLKDKPSGDDKELSSEAVTEEDSATLDDLRARIELWEKLVRVNKRLEREEETLVRLHVKWRRLRCTQQQEDQAALLQDLARVSGELEQGAREIEHNSLALAETEALLVARRRYLRRLQEELDASERETERLNLEMHRATSEHSPETTPTTSSNAANDTDSNSDTGLSSLHSSSEEGVYVLDTLV